MKRIIERYFIVLQKNREGMMDKNGRHYLLCIENYEETDIYGLFTDVIKLKKAYEVLKTYDCRVKEDKDFPRVVIYDLEENKFWIDSQNVERIEETLSIFSEIDKAEVNAKEIFEKNEDE